MYKNSYQLFTNKKRKKFIKQRSTYLRYVTATFVSIPNYKGFVESEYVLSPPDVMFFLHRHLVVC